MGFPAKFCLAQVLLPTPLIPNRKKLCSGGFRSREYNFFDTMPANLPEN